MEMLNQETDPEIKKQKQNQETVGQYTSCLSKNIKLMHYSVHYTVNTILQRWSASLLHNVTGLQSE